MLQKMEDHLQQQLANGFVLNLRMTFSFIPERYWRAVLRSAYLAVFHTDGYGWMFGDGASRVHDVITEMTSAARRDHGSIPRAGPKNRPACANSGDADHTFRFDGDHDSE